MTKNQDQQRQHHKNRKHGMEQNIANTVQQALVVLHHFAFLQFGQRHDSLTGGNAPVT